MGALGHGEDRPLQGPEWGGVRLSGQNSFHLEKNLLNQFCFAFGDKSLWNLQSSPSGETYL